MLRAIVKKKTLLNPLSKIQTVVDRKTTMHLLNNVLIGTEDNNIILEATDLEISYKGIFNADIRDSGEITVNARRFYEIVREIPTEEFQIEQLPENWLKISFGDKGEYKLGGLSTENFPRFTFFDKTFYLKLDSDDLKDMLKRTIVAVSNDESKYALTGLLIETEKDKGLMRAVGSDSHRLNLKEIKFLDVEMDRDISIIVPKKAIIEMIKLLEGDDSDSTKKDALIYSDDKFLHLSKGQEHLNMRLLDGSYPDYRLILPSDRIRFSIINRLDMLSVMKRVSIVNPDPEIKSVKMSFSGDRVIVESLSKESSDAKEILATEYSGEEFEMAINAKYLIDTLNVMKSEKVKLTLNDDESPCVIEGDDDPGFLALIMPMSLEE